MNIRGLKRWRPRLPPRHLSRQYVESVSLQASAQSGPAAFDIARGETVRYHEALYASASLGQADTWLARPHRIMSDALDLLPEDRPVVAYDLGAGIGRHTIPMLRDLPDGSRVYAVDLLPSALNTLADSVPPDTRTRLISRVADLDAFEFEEPADLVLAFSAIEHLPDLTSIRRLLERVRTALRPGGVVAIGVVADRVEVDRSGTGRPALLESQITTADARALLATTFDGFTLLDDSSRPTEVREQRGADAYTLSSTLTTWIATKPA